MNRTNETILNTILNHRIAGLPFSQGQIHPFYDGLSIANIPASICNWLDSPLKESQPLDKIVLADYQRSYQHVIFLVVDGLGLNFVKKFDSTAGNDQALAEWKSIFPEVSRHVLTSIAPSTTSAALTTFWTGKLPAEHGIIGYELFLKEYGFIANMITHSVASFIGENGNIYKAGFDPDTFLPVLTLGDHFVKNGVKTFALQHQSIAGSGLSRMLLHNVQSIAFDSLENLWQQVSYIHKKYKDERTYTYIYWGEMDTLSHHSVPNSPELIDLWKAFTRPMVKFIQDFETQPHTRTLFLMTADHGQIPTTIEADFDLHNHPGLVEHLVMMPSGEGRLPFIFTLPDHGNAVQDYLASHWEGRFEMHPSRDVLASGLLGTGIPYQGTIDRFGQYIIFPKDNAYWWWVNKENRLLGRHGGLSVEEMLVPLFVLEI
jgi:hypothetical protein